jgi:hypothetical protein
MLSSKIDPGACALTKHFAKWTRLLTAAAVATAATSAFAVQEIEPNNTCATAQVLGAIAPNSPITVNGALTTPPSVPDVDFYKVTGATPGNVLRVHVTGGSDGVDTLVLPMAAVLNSSCGVIQNSGATDPITFETVVPSDGVLLLAVTSCCDFQLTGSGYYAGTYTLTVTELVPVQSVSGRVVDAVTSQPVSSVLVNLTVCGDPSCSPTTQVFVGQVFTDPMGQYSFTTTYFGGPLDPGTYQGLVIDYQGRYLQAQFSFSAAGGEQKIVPDVALTPTPVIGSVSGRIVDSVTHAPLSGVSPPHAYVSMYAYSGYAFSFASGFADSAGRFTFAHDQSGRPLIAATYFVTISAEQYQQLGETTAPIPAGANQDLGDIQLVSNPIRFTLLRGCSNVPITGGRCEYQVQITNAIARSIEGEAWATINAYGLQSFVTNSLFQTNVPQEMNLAAATRTYSASRTASFEFSIPGTVPVYAFICPTFWFGVDPVNPQLYVQGAMTDYTSCVQRTATGYTPATDDQANELRKEAHEHEAKQRAAMSPH